MNKGKSQVIHAKRRALQRYGITLTQSDYDDLCLRIRKGFACHVIKKSNTRSIFLIAHETFGKLLVCYDKARGNINTFLPSELVEPVEKNLDDRLALIDLLDLESDGMWQ